MTLNGPQEQDNGEWKKLIFTTAFMMNCHLNSFQIKSHKERLVQGTPLNFKNNVPSLLEYLEVCLGSEYQKGNSLY